MKCPKGSPRALRFIGYKVAFQYSYKKEYPICEMVYSSKGLIVVKPVVGFVIRVESAVIKPFFESLNTRIGVCFGLV